MRVVASLTTSPTRIHKLAPTLMSLELQTRHLDRIVLNLPLVFSRTGEAYSVPEWIERNHPRVLINRVPVDYGPATKLIPTLMLEKDAYILVVDDDQRYDRHLVERYLAAASPTRAVCQAGILKDLTTSKRQSEVEVFEAYGGVLLHTSMFGPDFLPYMEVVCADPVARICDDLTMSLYLRRRRGVTIQMYADREVNGTQHWLKGNVLQHGQGADALFRQGDTLTRYRQVRPMVEALLAGGG